jgi:predicted O-methyltransferase YrrM
MVSLPMSSRDASLLTRILTDQPRVHNRYTEVARPWLPAESYADRRLIAEWASPGFAHYGIGTEVLQFLAETVTAEYRTLETGAGSSTLVFALKRASHIAITPAADEIDRIRAYGASIGLSMESVTFVAQPSERYLPSSDVSQLDLVLIDGKHAFPWPMLDWFYCVDKLRRGGLLLIDDVQLSSVAVIAEFMTADPGWQLVREFGNTHAYRKTKDTVLDISWDMQPWTVHGRANRVQHARSRLRRIGRAVRQGLALRRR